MAPVAVSPERTPEVPVVPKTVPPTSVHSHIIPTPVTDLLNPEQPDFRAELATQGYTVVKGVIPLDRVTYYREKAYDWLKSFPGSQLDFNNPDTWIEANLPKSNGIRTYASYCVPHEKFMWAARLEPSVLEAFSTLWRTDELLVSFDTLNITLPNRKDQERRKPWEHIDQSPLRRGIHCVQGIICLSPAGPEDGGLVVFPGSHNVNEEFFYGSEIAAPRRKEWLPMRDVYLFNQDELDWFHSRGLRPHKVCAEPGDLILWDSRTIHYGAEPTEKSSQIRTAIYAAYTPARFARKEQLELKKRIFENYGATSHWPHEQIVVKPREVYLPDGTRDPRDRDEPLEKPILSDRLLQLAGIKSY